MSPSTGVSSSTEASGLNPRSNKKKDRITQTSSSNKKKNKVEDHPRIAKSSFNNVNRVSKLVCNANVKHSMLNTNSELICATCNECMLDAIHDLCFHDYLNDVNARVKSKFVKSKSAKSNMKKIWKPTGKVYTNVGYSWKPTGRIFGHTNHTLVPGLRLLQAYDQEVVLPSIDEFVAMEVHSPLVEQTNVVKSGGESYPPLPTQGTTPAGNTLGKSLYANVIGESSKKTLNIRTLYPPGGNGVDVVVLVESIRAVSVRFENFAYGFFLEKRVAYPVVANYVRNMYGKFGLVRSIFSSSTGRFSFKFNSMDGLNAMLENGTWFIRSHPIILKKWNPDVNLLKEDAGSVSVWVKLHGVPVAAFSEDGLSVITTKLGTPIMLDSYTADMCLQSWGRLSYARVMIELRADVELKDATVVEYPKNLGFGAGVGEIKNKKSSQAPKGIPVGPKMAFKPNQEYRTVSKNNTANSSSNKKKGVESTNKVSDSNHFEVLNSVDNDVEMGTNGGSSNLDKNRANSYGFSEAILVDEAGNPLKKVEYPNDHDSEDEVASDDNDMARSLASERTGFSTQSLLELWRDSYSYGDYDEDPYDDDMYEGNDLSKEIQTICDKLDICNTPKIRYAAEYNI
ncbi:retrotransposon protein, putative, ty1-copia subclass [Tanacetum coccineum]|uniref:Retrotransposon protein, putative, ty1-copia subclass n=1 Tax=Tanacetum coccineum TaxID=301880 RepID=A0ABQ5ED00_9ASTR